MNKYLIISHYNGLESDGAIIKIEEGESTLNHLIEYISDREDLMGQTRPYIDAFKLKELDESGAFNSITLAMAPYGFQVVSVNYEGEIEDDREDKWVVIDNENNVKFITTDIIDQEELVKFVTVMLSSLKVSKTILNKEVERVRANSDILNIDTLSGLGIINSLLFTHGFRSFFC